MFNARSLYNGYAGNCYLYKAYFTISRLFAEALFTMQSPSDATIAQLGKEKRGLVYNEATKNQKIASLGDDDEGWNDLRLQCSPYMQ